MGADAALIARDESVALEDTGGFLVLSTPRAADISARLFERGVWTDTRGEALRLGPAPYLCDAQLHRAMDELKLVLDGIETPAKADAASPAPPPPRR
jgi:kynureninase